MNNDISEYIPIPLADQLEKTVKMQKEVDNALKNS